MSIDHSIIFSTWNLSTILEDLWSLGSLGNRAGYIGTPTPVPECGFCTTTNDLRQKFKRPNFWEYEGHSFLLGRGRIIHTFFNSRIRDIL